MKTKHYYYLLEMNSTGQTHRETIFHFNHVPTQTEIDNKASVWLEQFSHLDYFTHLTRIKTIPKNRRDALKKWNIICAKRNKINRQHALLRNLLMLPPFNGTNP